MIRPLQLFLQADCLPDPSDVFTFLADHNIGQGQALFYIAHATSSEMQGNYSLADSIYQKGILAKAAPVERLEQKFKDFQHRMVRRIQRKAAEQTTDVQHSTRKSLKTLKTSKTQLQKRKTISTPPRGSNSSIPVFVDEEFSSGAAASWTSTRGSSQPSGSMPLPNFDQSRKENIQAAIPWVGQKIEQKHNAKTIKPDPVIEVFGDPELESKQIEQYESSKIHQKLRQRLDQSNGERLTADPLRLLKNPEEARDKDVLKSVKVVEHTAAGDACEAVRSSPFEVEGSIVDNSGEDDVTMATKDAYQTLNCLFTGDTTGRIDVSENEIELEPTMTINTREALSKVNDMFKASFSMSDEGHRGHATSPEQTREVPLDLEIREDTIFLTKNEPSSSSFLVREDTVFLSDHNDGKASPSLSLDIREDTVFLNHGEQDSPRQEQAESPVFTIREDTVFISKELEKNLEENSPRLSSKEGSLPDQNEFDNDLNGNGSDPRRKVEEEDTVIISEENDENAIPENTEASIPRNRVHRQVPLTELDEDELCEAGIHISELPEFEDNLASQQHNTESEGFQVYDDEVKVDMRFIDPFCPSFQRRMIRSLDPPVNTWPNVYELSNEKAVELEQKLKSCSLASTDVHVSLPGLENLCLQGKIGSGSYANIYGAEDKSNGAALALKVEYPPCPWEWLLCKAVEGRNQTSDARSSLVIPRAMYLSSNFSVIVMAKGEYGTLQDLLNSHLKEGKVLHQVVAARLVISLFEIMQQLHSCKVLHNDIKPDNVIIGLHQEGNTTDISLQLIDIGRGVDIELLPDDTLLKGDSETDAFRCVEMREMRPWLWQADTYSIACVLHCLIFGQYMEVERVIDESNQESFIRRKLKLPRSWNEGLWDGLFHELLNHTSLSPANPPCWSDLMERLGNWLKQEANALKYDAEVKTLISHMKQR